LRALEEECGRLKRLVAELAVQNQILKEVNAKKW
jgi:putative transposase